MSVTINGEIGILNTPSNHDVPTTIGRLENLAKSRGLTLYALIDFREEARKLGRQARDKQLLIFGDRVLIYQMMSFWPSSAIDLPFKVLVWEDASGVVWISYNNPSYLKVRHGIPDNYIQQISGLSLLIMDAGRK